MDWVERPPRTRRTAFAMSFGAGTLMLVLDIFSLMLGEPPDSWAATLGVLLLCFSPMLLSDSHAAWGAVSAALSSGAVFAFPFSLATAFTAFLGISGGLLAVFSE